VLRIGIVSQSYYPRYGGVTEHVHHTAVELRRRGHQVTIVTGHFRSNRETNHAAGVERVGHNVLIPFNRAFVDFTLGFTLRQQLRRLFEEREFDLVHTHLPISPTLPLFAVQTARCAQVGTFHATTDGGLLQSAFHPMLARAMARLDARIAVSPTAERSIARFFPGRYDVIPNGVDLERFRPDLEPFEEYREPGRVNLLFVGRLDPRKGLQTLLAAMPEVIEGSAGRARLLVIGDSCLRARFEAAVPGPARGHVRFLGHVPSGDLPRWYATADVFVSPASGNESFGIVLLEAMASGLPLVASDIPGYRTVVTPDETGVTVPPGDPRALAHALIGLLGDAARRGALAARARERAREFSWPRVTERIEAVYRRALASRAAATGLRA
jgi:phosphatidyl-myo-inositol alpha-mannosyltransferase